jgi:hypothetical protein
LHVRLKRNYNDKKIRRWERVTKIGKGKDHLLIRERNEEGGGTNRVDRLNNS